ncbi:MAG: hypothetical protein QOH17_568 [Pseudonocardiales bacterium]|jgi:pimeloyl-ACP methyl ester carboxylesterase|nr:hypothetical protein [Pseudonocardiales bacterium]
MTPSWVAHLGVRLARTMPMVSQAEIDGLAEAFGSFADHGARSAFTHTVRGALNLSGHSRLEVFDDAGHFPHTEQPQRFAYLVRSQRGPRHC